MVVNNAVQTVNAVPVALLCGMFIVIMLKWLTECTIRTRKAKQKAIIKMMKNKEDAEFLKEFWHVEDIE